MYFLVSLAFAGLAVAVFAPISLMFSRSKARALAASITLFSFLFFPGWLFFWSVTPVMNFGVVYWQIAYCLLVASFVGLILMIFDPDSGTARAVGVGASMPLLLVVWMFFGMFHSVGKTDDQAMATRFAKMANITYTSDTDDLGSYPETDPEHMVLMPQAAAATKADSALNTTVPGYDNISSVYDVHNGALQSIAGHLYWVFDLRIDGWRNANRGTNRLVPCYIMVDAEDLNALAKPNCDYRMKYTPGAPTGNSMTRLIWGNYPSYVVDDLTLEVRDDGHPYYTATINRPATTFEKELPVKAIVVDPVTGKIDEYPLGSIPKWIDRIYSDDTVKKLMNWWGHWGAGPDKAPFKRFNEGSANRLRMSGDPILVYTKDGGVGHPEWQFLMTSWKADRSATYVGLFNAHTNNVRLYRIKGMQIEPAVAAAFATNGDVKAKGYVPVHMALHMIYGRLTWVAPLIPNAAERNGPITVAQLGMMPANNIGATTAVVAPTKEELLRKYRAVLAGADSSGNNPTESAKTIAVTGTVKSVASAVLNGTTTFYLVIEEDPSHIYSGQYDQARVELPFGAVGARVTMQYLDTGGRVRDIVSYDDLGLSVQR